MDRHWLYCSCSRHLGSVGSLRNLSNEITKLLRLLNGYVIGLGSTGGSSMAVSLLLALALILVRSLEADITHLL